MKATDLKRLLDKGKRNVLIPCFLLCFLWAGACLCMAETEGNLYLTPQRLFHISRSINRNLVCYDVNLVGGKLDKEKPLSVYWVNREERMGEKNGLNFFQRKMVYGYKVVEEGENSCTVTLTAYSGKKFLICRRGERYVCETTIDGKKAVLKYLYVKVSEHNPMGVDYVELHGEALSSKEEVVERITD